MTRSVCIEEPPCVASIPTSQPWLGLALRWWIQYSQLARLRYTYLTRLFGILITSLVQYWSGLDVLEVAMADPTDHVGLSSSMTDLMTSLAVIFILLLVASHNNKQQQLNIK